MLTMRYRIQLPADYAMSIIEKRIAERGHLTDGLPGLGFKAYLYSCKGDAETGSRFNSYAPFYLWRTAEGMNGFLSGPGFDALCESFGRPAVESALAWFGEWRDDASEARYAVVESWPLPMEVALEGGRGAQADWGVTQLADKNVLAAVAAFDPNAWILTRMLLLRHPPEGTDDGFREYYRVGRVSTGGRHSPP